MFCLSHFGSSVSTSVSTSTHFSVSPAYLMASRARALMVVHLRGGVQVYVNDENMGIALIKQLQGDSSDISRTSSPPSTTCSATQSAMPSTQSSACSSRPPSPECEKAATKYDRASLLRYASPPGLRLCVRNTFLQLEEDGKAEHGKCSVQSAPASCGDHAGADRFYMGDMPAGVGVQTDADFESKSVQDASTETCARVPTCDAEIQTSTDIIDIAKCDSERLKSLVGAWAHTNRPDPGAVIKVQTAFLSGESCPLPLEVGELGSVTKIDGDGDAVVYFPRLAMRGESSKVCILREDFQKTRVLKFSSSIERASASVPT